MPTDSQISLVCSCGKGRTEQKQTNPALTPQTLGEQLGSFALPSHWMCRLCPAAAPWKSNPTSNPTLPPGTFSQQVLVSMGFTARGDFNSSSADSILFKLQWELQTRTPKANHRTTNKKNRTLKASASQLLMDIRWENRPPNKHLHPRCGASPGRVAGLALLKERSQGHASWRQEAQSKGRLL